MLNRSQAPNRVAQTGVSPDAAPSAHVAVPSRAVTSSTLTTSANWQASPPIAGPKLTPVWGDTDSGASPVSPVQEQAPDAASVVPMPVIYKVPVEIVWPKQPVSSSEVTVYVAPQRVTHIRGVSIFLAGSIEQGLKAVMWQPAMIEQLRATQLAVTLFNPRRPDWDASLQQSARNALFAEQVKWELWCQERADVIMMFFDPSTLSPITLLELGLFAHTKKLVVCCPQGYWRKGNVEMVCERYGIPLAGSFKELVDLVEARTRGMLGGTGARVSARAVDMDLSQVSVSVQGQR